MWFVAIDAHSKWHDVVRFPVGTTGMECIISVLRQMFAHFGTPRQILSDNRPQFTGTEFDNFCHQQGLLHTLTPPYHPSDNGQMECFIQSFKRAVRKGLERENSTLQKVVDDFLQLTET